MQCADDEFQEFKNSKTSRIFDELQVSVPN